MHLLERGGRHSGQLKLEAILVQVGVFCFLPKQSLEKIEMAHGIVKL